MMFLEKYYLVWELPVLVPLLAQHKQGMWAIWLLLNKEMLLVLVGFASSD